LRRWLTRCAAIDVGRSQLVDLERALFAPAEVWLSAGWVARSCGDGRVSLVHDPETRTA
jgi:hypothetical protein